MLAGVVVIDTNAIKDDCCIFVCLSLPLLLLLLLLLLSWRKILSIIAAVKSAIHLW